MHRKTRREPIQATRLLSWIPRPNALLDLIWPARRSNSLERLAVEPRYDLFIANEPEPAHPDVDPVSVQVPVTVLLCSVPLSCS